VKPHSFRCEAELKRIQAALLASEEKYRNFLETIEDSYYEVDLKGKLVFSNSAYCRLLGYTASELREMTNRQYQTPEGAAWVYKAFNEVYHSGISSKSFDWELRRKDGGTVWGNGSIHLVRDEHGNPAGFRGIIRDVTERRKIEQDLRESEARFRSLTKLSSDWYWEQDAEFRFSRLEGQYAAGGESLADESVLGKRRWETGLEIASEGGWDAHRELLEAYLPFRDAVMCRTIEDGTQRFFVVHGHPLFDRDGHFSGYRGVGRDITERKRDEERIKYLATHDSLTGLPNRAMFSQLLNMAIETARRYQRTFAVMFLDLDRFKLINDTLGHEAGDQLLREVSQRLAKCVRVSDVVARLGGDEFVVLLQEIGEPEQAAVVARKILASIIQPVMLLGQECRITTSVGVAMYPEHAQDELSLMKNADMAMYFAKEEGKNNFQFYSRDIKAQIPERLSLETSLRRALETNEFFLLYQAKQDLKTRRITGVEALLRWRHPGFGVLSPLKFIPLAEETGLIVPIGKWVLNTACAQNMAWQRQGLPPICMAVNLSVRQFDDENLLKDIIGALKISGMPAELLELELTESMVMRNPDRASRLLGAIKNLGVRLAIDDFGVGYSSLAQIRRFPIDTLKVDRSFIRNLPQSGEDCAITEAIIAMGRALSLTVIAEGVENQEQETFLRNLACDQSQGFHFSKPISDEAFSDLLRQHTAARG
jgi:diguanylate cyclase (GGDEF)-like protein/PAS domain S-box-containing protein